MVDGKSAVLPAASAAPALALGRKSALLLAAAVATALCVPLPAAGQDLEPRALSPAPVGLNIAGVGYIHAQGNVFFDKALLIDDATGVVQRMTGFYVRTFGILGKSAKFVTVVPFAWGEWEGTVAGDQAATSRRGFADPFFQLVVGLAGSPAVSPRDFVAYSEGFVVGASISVVAPLGQYDPAKLINLGSNRWAFRPRLGFSGRAGRWTFEALGDVWLFTENPEAFGGTVMEQKPFYAVQGNVIYSFGRGFWLAVSGGLADGGQLVIDGVEKETIDMNSRLGAVFVIPVARRWSLKVSYTNSVRTKLGGDYDLVGVTAQYRWGGGL